MKLDRRVLVSAIIAGVFVCLGSGLIENRPDFPTIPENRYYGYPVAWRLSNINRGERYMVTELIVDLSFWVVIVSIMAVIASVVLKRDAERIS